MNETIQYIYGVRTHTKILQELTFFLQFLLSHVIRNRDRRRNTWWHPTWDSSVRKCSCHGSVFGT